MYMPYILPMALYLVLTGLGSAFDYRGYLLYPVKTVLVLISLLYFRRRYREVELRQGFFTVLMAVATGLVAFVVWVVPEGWYPQMGNSEFNPYVFGAGYLSAVLILFRLVGAVLVVPVFEELFWRSFVIRYLIESDFRRVPMGQFTWFSFVATSVLFGFEHHRWLVGIATGILYNGLLYYRKKLFPCIVAHAVTNLALGIYVLWTEQWTFW